MSWRQVWRDAFTPLAGKDIEQPRRSHILMARILIHLGVLVLVAFGAALYMAFTLARALGASVTVAMLVVGGLSLLTALDSAIVVIRHERRRRKNRIT